MPLTGACAYWGFAVVTQLGRTAVHCQAAAAWEEASEMLSWLVLKVPGTVNSDHGPVKLDLLARDSFGRT